MKKNNNKGFTLVELIVVLVILAILAAILVPALLGYIDRAREKQYVLNARSYMTAAQAEMSSVYGANLAPARITDTGRKTAISDTADVADCTNFVIYCAADNGSGAVKSNHAAYTITGAVYEEGSVRLVYKDGAWYQHESDVPTGTAYDVK